MSYRWIVLWKDGGSTVKACEEAHAENAGRFDGVCFARYGHVVDGFAVKVGLAHALAHVCLLCAIMLQRPIWKAHSMVVLTLQIATGLLATAKPGQASKQLEVLGRLSCVQHNASVLAVRLKDQPD